MDSPRKKKHNQKKKIRKKFLPSVLSSGDDGDDSSRHSITTTRFRPYSSRSSSSELKSLSVNSYKNFKSIYHLSLECKSKQTLTGRIRFLDESKLVDEIND